MELTVIGKLRQVEKVTTDDGASFLRVIIGDVTHYLMDSSRAGAFGVAIKRSEEVSDITVYYPYQDAAGADAATVAERLAKKGKYTIARSLTRTHNEDGSTDYKVSVPCYWFDREKADTQIPHRIDGKEIQLKSVYALNGFHFESDDVALRVCQAVAILSDVDGDPEKDVDEWGGRENRSDCWEEGMTPGKLEEFLAHNSFEPVITLAIIETAINHPRLSMRLISDAISARVAAGGVNLLDYRPDLRQENASTLKNLTHRANRYIFPAFDSFIDNVSMEDSDSVWWMKLRLSLSQINHALKVEGEVPIEAAFHPVNHVHVEATGDEATDRAQDQWARSLGVPVVYGCRTGDHRGEEPIFVVPAETDSATLESIRSGEFACRCDVGLFAAEFSLLNEMDAALAKLSHSHAASAWELSELPETMNVSSNDLLDLRGKESNWRASSFGLPVRFAYVTATEGEADFSVPDPASHDRTPHPVTEEPDPVIGPELDRYIRTEVTGTSNGLLRREYIQTGELKKKVYGDGTADLVRLGNAVLMAVSLTRGADETNDQTYARFAVHMTEVLSLPELAKRQPGQTHASGELYRRRLEYVTAMAETYFTDPDNLETPFSWWAKLSGLTLIV